MFDVFADSACLCTKNDADIVVTFALCNLEEDLGFARRQLPGPCSRKWYYHWQ
jgi:hypothetical protein